MTTPFLVVLWVYSAMSWGFHGVLISPGWASIMVYDTYEECIEGRNIFPIRYDIHSAMCLYAGLEPEGEIAHPLEH